MHKLIKAESDNPLGPGRAGPGLLIYGHTLSSIGETRPVNSGVSIKPNDTMHQMINTAISDWRLEETALELGKLEVRFELHFGNIMPLGESGWYFAFEYDSTEYWICMNCLDQRPYNFGSLATPCGCGVNDRRLRSVIVMEIQYREITHSGEILKKMF